MYCLLSVFTAIILRMNSSYTAALAFRPEGLLFIFLQDRCARKKIILVFLHLRRLGPLHVFW